MATTVRASDVRPEANPVHRNLSDVRPVAAKMRPDAKEDALSARSGVTRARVREAMSLAGISQKEFAINAKQPQSVVSEALGGIRAIQLDWLELQDQPFKTHYNALERDGWGIDAQTEQIELEAMAARFFAVLLRARRTA